MFSVCADGSVVWYFWCPGCRGELQFLYCEIFHGTPYAVCVELNNLYLFVFYFVGLLFDSCVGVCGCGDVRSWGGCCWGGDVWKFV